MSNGSYKIGGINKLNARSVGCHRWFVFLSACVVMINGYGFLNSIGSMFAIVMDTFKTSRAEAVLIQSMAYGCSGIMGIITGSFVHKYNPRKCGMVGTILSAIGLCLCFFATSVIYLYIGIGFMYGLGMSLLCISGITIVGHHFEGKLNLVVLSLISVASAIGGMTYPYGLVLLKSVGCHRWFVFLSACVVMMNGFGLLNSIGSLLAIVMDTFKTSRAEAVLIQSMASGGSGMIGIITGSFVHKYHPRKCGIVGASLTSIGFSLCFFATSVIYLYVGIGLLFGFGLSLASISSTTIIGHYFDGKLKLIVLSLTSVSSAMGGMAYPYVLLWLHDLYGIRGALLVVGAIILNSFAVSLLWTLPEQMIVETVSDQNDTAKIVKNRQQNKHNSPSSSNLPQDENDKSHERNICVVSKYLIEETDQTHNNCGYVKEEATALSTDEIIDNTEIMSTSFKSSIRNTDNTKDDEQASYAYTNAAVVTEDAHKIEKHKENHVKCCKTRTKNFDEGDPQELKYITKFPKKTITPKTNSIIDSFKSLLRNGVFVSFVIATALLNVSVNDFLFLIVDIFRDKGFISADSSLALLLMSLFSILGRFASGSLTLIPHVTVLSISCAGAFVLATAHGSVVFVCSSTMMLFLSSVFGVCMGIGRAQFVVTTSRLLDKQQLSIDVGVTFAIYGPFNILIGPLCGYARDQLGSYQLIFVGAAITSGLGCCLFGLAQYLSSRNNRMGLTHNEIRVPESKKAEEKIIS